jgi:hypothetical protein
MKIWIVYWDNGQASYTNETSARRMEALLWSQRSNITRGTVLRETTARALAWKA